MQTLPLVRPVRRPLRRPVRRRGLAAWFGAALERQRSRRALACLDAAALRDIGLTRAEALAESARPFWR